MAVNGFWLESNSAEYDYVRYHLTASTSHLGIIEKLNIWKINNSELQYRYERRCNGMLKISSWFNAELLDHENNLEQLCTRGFHFDPSKSHGLEFPTGIIQFPEETEITLDHCFLLLEIAIGRSFVYDGILSKAQIPQGYDSLYLPEQPLDRNQDGKFSLQEYQNAAAFDHRNASAYNHRYFISDVNQVAPKYIVRFKLQSPKLTTTLLENIQNQLLNPTKSPLNYQQLNCIDPITLLPPEQTDPSVSKMMGTTTSTAANAFNPSLSGGGGVGNGAGSGTGTFDSRKYVPIEKLYSQATEEITYLENDPSGQSKNQWIQRQLSNIDEKVREINLNYVDIIESIDTSVEQAKNKLQRFIREKLELCLSIEIELRRQLEQMSWYNSIITYELKKYQHYIVESHNNEMLRKYFMLEFLKLWKQHTLLKNGLNRLKPNELSVISNIHGDIRANTEVKLYIDPFYAANHSVSSPVGVKSTALPSATAAANAAATADKKVFQTLPNPHQDLAASSVSVNQTVHQFTQRAKQNEIFTLGQTIQMDKNGPDSPTKLAFTSPIQSIIEQEMDTIQELIQKESARNYTGLRLPLSISRPFLPNSQLQLPQTGSNRSNSEGINMHSLIDLLKSSPTISEQQKLINSLGKETLDNVSNIGDLDTQKIKSSFMDNLPDLLGLGAEVEFQNLNLTMTAEAKKSPPSSPKLGASNPNSNTNNKNKSKNAAEVPPNPFVNSTSTNIEEFTLSALDKEELIQRMSTEQLKHFLQYSFPNFKTYQLTEFSLKKQNQMQVKFLLNEAKVNNNNTNGLIALKKSKLLLENERELVFFTLPFFNKLPILTLIYSTIEHRRDLEELYSKTNKNRNPTLIIVRSGELRFGAYLNQAPLPTSAWNGNPQCFLFSLTLNLKLPYHGRAGHQVSLTNDDEMTNNTLLFLQEPHAFFGTNDMLMIGNGDLVLDSKLTIGKSEVEMSYGVGLPKKPSNIPQTTSKGTTTMSSIDVTKCILGGGPTFPISDLEVWTIQY